MSTRKKNSQSIFDSIVGEDGDSKGFRYKAMLVSLRAGHISNAKTDKKMRSALAGKTGLSDHQVTALKKRFPSFNDGNMGGVFARMFDDVKKPYTKAVGIIHKLAQCDWSRPKTDHKGSRKDDGWFCVMNENIDALEEHLKKLEAQRIKALEALLKVWPEMIECMRNTLKSKDGPYTDPVDGEPTWFNADDYPTSEQEIRDRYYWRKEWSAISKVSDTANDIRLLHPTEWGEEQAKLAEQAQMERIANIFIEEVKDISDWANNMRQGSPSKANGSGGVVGYTPLAEGETDGRKGNTLPKKASWRKLASHIETLKTLNGSLSDPTLASALTRMEKLYDNMMSKGPDLDEAVENMRKELKGSKEARDKLVQELNEIEESVTPAIGNFADLLGRRI